LVEKLNMSIDLMKKKHPEVQIVVVFDEYYDCLRRVPLSLDLYGKISPLFTIGDDPSQVLVISSAHHSVEWKRFLAARFESVDFSFCHDDYPDFRREQQLDQVDVVCDHDQDKLLRRMVEDINIYSANGPSIVFGLCDDPTLKDYAAMINNSMTAKEDNDVELMSSFAHSNSKGVILLSEKYTVGADVKF